MMKKITYMLLAGALLCSCADEKPHFLPAPGGTVEIGGIGATPSSDAAALLAEDPALAAPANRALAREMRIAYGDEGTGIGG